MIPPVSVCHQDAQAAERIGQHVVEGRGHERTDGRGRGVKNRDVVLVNDLPKAARRGVRGHALKQQRGAATQQRAVEQIRVPCDPANIGGAPVNVVFLNLKHVLERVLGPHHVAGLGVHHAFGLAGAAAGVEDKQRVLSRHFHGRAGFGHVPHFIVKPDVAVFFHLHGPAGMLHHQHAAHAGAGE
nr:hypothetical protein [Tanacetum cinerariifolium]